MLYLQLHNIMFVLGASQSIFSPCFWVSKFLCHSWRYADQAANSRPGFSFPVGTRKPFFSEALESSLQPEILKLWNISVQTTGHLVLGLHQEEISLLLLFLKGFSSDTSLSETMVTLFNEPGISRGKKYCLYVVSAIFLIALREGSTKNLAFTCNGWGEKCKV